MAKRKVKRKLDEADELARLPALVDELPADDSKFGKFSDFPLSTRTQTGLRKAGYAVPTDIQRSALRLALQGHDVLGAAKTGSGKTLAFLIPVLEKLWREKWSPVDGIGAIIISPTRELAYQTFQVLRKVGSEHSDISAGLVIGGKDLSQEQKHIGKTNIIICTPGRLLQHMDETPGFSCDNLQVLVLDEADRILDLGFAPTLNAIVENLPATRQTMLFSATQTKSVRDLVRLSLTDPEYVAVHEAAEHSTPQRLTQSYIEVDLQDKLMVLFSFIRTNLQTKGIVFMSCCKQVKFVYECFCRLRPGVPLLALYGKQKQMKRMGIYNDFRKKQHAYLFATDIAARGLDFPAVNWVIQLDCPEDASTYIHRAGRTARYEKDGQALLMLLPSEREGMLKALEQRKVPITEIRPNPRKLQEISSRLESFCAANQEIKHWAQKTFHSYVRSVFLQGDKDVFDVKQLPLEAYAKSLGLVSTPKVRFLKKAEKLRQQQMEKKAEKAEKVRQQQQVKSVGAASSQSESCSDDSDSERHSVAGAVFNGTSTLSVASGSESDDGSSDSDGSDSSNDGESSDDDLLKPRKSRKPRELDEVAMIRALQKDKEEEARKAASHVKSKARIARSVLKKNIKANTHVVFDEEGDVESSMRGEVDLTEVQDECQLVHLKPVPLGKERDHSTGGLDLTAASIEMRGADLVDLQRHRQRIKEKHQEQRLKRKRSRREAMEGDGDDATVQLGSSTFTGEPDSDSDMDNSSPPPTKKHRRLSKHANSHVDKDHDNGDASFETGGSLKDDEALALHLLSNG